MRVAGRRGCGGAFWVRGKGVGYLSRRGKARKRGEELVVVLGLGGL